jgi:PadR family transcriptional regulator, regulatory protein PadR
MCATTYKLLTYKPISRNGSTIELVEQRKTDKQTRATTSIATKKMPMTPDASEYKKEIVRRLTKNLLDIQLLRLIDAEPMWGYKIKKTFETDLGIKLRHGALYPTLNALEQQGLVTSKKQQQNGRARKIYSLTPMGKECLQAYYAVLKEQIKNKTAK